MVKKVLMSFAMLTLAYLSMSYSSGPGSGGAGDRTGSPMGSSQTCSNGSGCHTSAGSFTPSVSVQVLNGSTPITSYASSTAYTVRVTVSSSTSVTSNTRYAFQIVCVQSSSLSAVNNWGTLPSGTHTYTLSGRVYIEQSSGQASGTFNIPWTSPATSSGNLTFYCTGNVVNNNGSETGDNCTSTSYTLPPAVSCTPPSLSTTVSNVLCNGGSTGSITLNTTGGTSPFTFAWTGPGGYTSIAQSPSGLKAGTYDVTVTATGGCTTTTTATVTEPATKITTSTSSNTPLCVGGTLNLNSTTSGGTGAYTYSWSGPAAFSNINSAATLTPVTTAMAGKYIFTATDANGCQAKDTETVVINAKPNADSISANAASSQTYNFLAINATGTPKYNWSYGDGNTDTIVAPSHTYTTGGSYTVRLILSNSCGSDTLYKQLFIAKVGVDNVQSLLSTILLSPNPAHHYTVIGCSATLKIQQASLYNIYGAKVVEQKFGTTGNYQLNTSSLPAGVYLMHIETDKGNTIKQLIVE